MNKGKKIISTLAIASMLAGNVLPLASLAAINKMDSGIYTQADGTTKYVGLRIHKDDRTQSLTVQDVENKLGKTVTNYTDKTTVVGTGSKVTTADGEYTVVLYGDVDGNGMVTSADASLIAESVVKTKTLTAPQAEAARVGVTSDANLGYDKEVTSKDASVIATYMVNKLDYVIDPMPESDPEQDVPADYAYTLTVNENNKITNVNEGNLTVELKLKEALSQNTTLQLVVFDESGAIISKTNAGFSRYVTSPVITNVPATVNVLKGAAGKVQNIASSIDATNVPDGKLYFRLYASTDTKLETPLAEQEVVKNTVVPAMAKVVAERDGIHRATFKGVRYGESDIQTVYYCAVPTTETGTPSWNADERTFGKAGNYTPVTRRINVNGSDTVQTTIEGLDENKAYNVYYVLENEHGSQTITTSSSDIPVVGLVKDEEATSETITAVTADKITLPKSASSSDAKFTITSLTPSEKYIATLYKNDNIIYEKELTANSYYNADFTLDYLNGGALDAGDYYIEVVKKGNAANNTLNSEPVKSKVLTVKAVSQVTDIKYTVDETTGYPKLEWKENDENCGGYRLNLYIQDPVTGITASDITTYAETSNAADTSIYFSATKPDTTNYVYGGSWRVGAPKNLATLWRNKDYKVEVIANVGSIEKPEENTIYIASEPTTLEIYAPYREAKVVSATDSTMKFELNLETTGYVYDKDAVGYGRKEADYQYSMRIYDNAGKYIETKPLVKEEVDDNKDGKVDHTYFTVEGLGANTAYKFRLVAKCGDFEGWSEFISNVKTLPRIYGLTVVGSKADCTAKSRTIYLGDIATSNKAIYVEGVEYKQGALTAGPAKENFKELLNFLKNLQTGDEISINANNITIGLNSSSSDNTALLKATFVKDKNVTIAASAEHERTLVTTTGSEPAEVHLKGNKAQYDIANLVLAKEGKITLEDTVYVKTAANPTNTFTVVKDADVTINDIGMSTSLDTTVKVENTTTLVVVANNTANNLVFESRNDKVDASQIKDLTIKFVSADSDKAVQQGSIVIKGNVAKSKVTVTQENVEVGSDITVTVEKGEVDVYGAKVTGTAVTLSPKDGVAATITVSVATPAPTVLRGTSLVIANYESADDLKDAMTGDVSVGYYPTEEDLTAVNNWLSSFDINGKGAIVSIDRADLSKVTITYNGTETLQVNGLK